MASLLVVVCLFPGVAMPSASLTLAAPASVSSAATFMLVLISIAAAQSWFLVIEVVGGHGLSEFWVCAAPATPSTEGATSSLTLTCLDDGWC